jgi:hypothetical protein
MKKLALINLLLINYQRRVLIKILKQWTAKSILIFWFLIMKVVLRGNKLISNITPHFLAVFECLRELHRSDQSDLQK